MNIPELNHCIFTDLRSEPLQSGRDAMEYTIEIGGVKHQISLTWDCLGWPNEQSFLNIKHVLAGLLLNDKWIDNEDKIIHLADLQNLVNERAYPSTPEQKLDNLFLELFKFQPSDGGMIILNSHVPLSELAYHFYFKNTDEYNFYFHALEVNELVNSVVRQGDNPPNQFRITYKGLNRAIELQSMGELSNKCFIAMSFGKEMAEVREAIRKAVIDTGFEPIIIDEKNVESDRTINDEIIVNLKKCKFCVADFTGQSKGVYFESGFAVGQGKKVIYTCQEDDFNKNAHFDIKPLQHILYKNTEQLTKELTNKIEAWVK